jgi:hypothetical protein
LTICIDSKDTSFLDRNIKELKSLCSDGIQEGCPVEIKYSSNVADAEMKVGDNFKIFLSDDNFKKLVNNYGKKNIDINYFTRQ